MTTCEDIMRHELIRLIEKKLNVTEKGQYDNCSLKELEEFWIWLKRAI